MEELGHTCDEENGGLAKEEKVTSSTSNQLHKTSQVPISAIPSLRRPTKLKHRALPKPSVAQTEQQASNDSEACTKNTVIKQIDMKGAMSSNVCGFSNCQSDAAKDIMSSLSKKDKKTQDVLLGKPYTAITKEIKHINSEACTKSTEIKHIDMNGAISSNVCGVSNRLSDAANDIMSSLSKKDKKTQDVFLGKPYTAIIKKLLEEICSISQISSNSLSEGSGMIGSALHSNGFENTRGSITSEGDEPDTTFADPSKKKISSKLSDSVSNLRIPCICTSEKDITHIEPKELPEVLDAQNSEEQLVKIKSQDQQAILVKISVIEEHANSSQDVQPVATEECQPQDNLQLYELRNDTSFVKENGLFPAKKMSLDNLKQGAAPLKHQLSSVPYSEEWLAAMENFGEDILAVKTGKVYNSPPDKAIPEPGPWSPVKRKSQDVGPFDCTKYCKK